MSTRASHRPLRASFAAALVAALLLMQTLGLMHGVVHHRGLVPASITAQATEQGSKGWVDKLFAGHEKGSTCSLFDQSTQPDALVDTACAATPAFAPQPPSEVHRAWHVALQAHGFLARGPPTRA